MGVRERHWPGRKCLVFAALSRVRLCWAGALVFAVAGCGSGKDASSGSRNSEVKVVTAGAGRVCVLRTDGKAKCLGIDFNPRLPQGLFKDITVSSGGTVCGLTFDGRVLCGGDADDPLVRNMPSRGRYEQLVGGDRHLCARADDGTVACWGGACTTSPCWSSGMPSRMRATFVAAGGNNTCIVEQPTGRVRCFGSHRDSLNASLTRTEGTRRISVSPTHACMVRADGSLLCGGERPKESEFGGTDYADIVADNGFNCALHGSGEIRCWRHGEIDGRSIPPQALVWLLGNGDPSRTPEPSNDKRDAPAKQKGSATSIQQPVLRLVGDRHVQQVAQTSVGHTCALFEDGETSCIRLRLKGRTRVPQGPLRHIAIVAAGGTVCGVNQPKGLVRCSGRAEDAIAAAAPTHGNHIQVVAGDKHACALTAGGLLTCWGMDCQGNSNCWHQDTVSTHVGNNVRVWRRSGVTFAAAAGEVTCMIDAQGHVRCVGEHDTHLRGNVSYRRVWVTPYQECAQTLERHVLCASDGLRGDNSHVSVGYIDAAIGSRSACGKEENGNILCWGDRSASLPTRALLWLLQR